MTDELATSDEGISKAEHTIALYTGASLLQLTDDEIHQLAQPVDEACVDIRPDGLVYLPQVFYRQRLNAIFRPGQWALIQHRITQDEDMLYFDGSLYVRGYFVSRAVGEAHKYASNKGQSWASVYESAKSDCITRCSKDLGTAKELWQPQWGVRWREAYAVRVWRTSSTKPVWRRKDAPAFYDETGPVTGESSATHETPDAAPVCPKCQSETRLKEGKSKAGKPYKFFGCVNYPRCDGTVWFSEWERGTAGKLEGAQGKNGESQRNELLGKYDLALLNDHAAHLGAADFAALASAELTKIAKHLTSPGACGICQRHLENAGDRETPRDDDDKPDPEPDDRTYDELANHMTDFPSGDVTAAWGTLRTEIGRDAAGLGVDDILNARTKKGKSTARPWLIELIKRLEAGNG